MIFLVLKNSSRERRIYTIPKVPKACTNRLYIIDLFLRGEDRRIHTRRLNRPLHTNALECVRFLRKTYLRNIDMRNIEWKRSSIIEDWSCNRLFSPGECALQPLFSMPHPYIDTIISVSWFFSWYDSSSTIFYDSYTESCDMNLRSKLVRLRSSEHANMHSFATRSRDALTLYTFLIFEISEEIVGLIW